MSFFSDLIDYLAKLCIEGNVALICGLVDWCDFQKLTGVVLCV